MSVSAISPGLLLESGINNGWTDQHQLVTLSSKDMPSIKQSAGPSLIRALIRKRPMTQEAARHSGDTIDPEQVRMLEIRIYALRAQTGSPKSLSGIAAVGSSCTWWQLSERRTTQSGAQSLSVS